MVVTDVLEEFVVSISRVQVVIFLDALALMMGASIRETPITANKCSFTS
jgi:hypothetical protein